MDTDASRVLAAGVRRGDAIAIARALTLVADEGGEGPALLADLATATGRAYVVGVTGPPGAGKSTLVDRLIAALRASDRTVGVLAVDPSSPFSGGAILGDRVRMQSHAGDAGVFIRSLATRGQSGGLGRGAAGAVAVLDAAGFDVVVVETVGVGQAELDITSVADVRVVVLVADAGDEVQTLKAGIMEIGDVFVINKCDRPGAERAMRAIEGMLSMGDRPPHGWSPAVVSTIAIDGTGVAALLEILDRFAREAADVIGDRRRRRAVSAPASAAFAAFLDHVGVAVQDSGPLLEFLARAAGTVAEAPIDVPAQGVRVRFVRLATGAVEIVEALDGSSPVASFLSRRGPGLHHLAIRVARLTEVLAALRSSGVRLIDETPRPGAEGRPVAFVHPASTGGVLVELIEMEQSPRAPR